MPGDGAVRSGSIKTATFGPLRGTDPIHSAILISCRWVYVPRMVVVIDVVMKVNVIHPDQIIITVSSAVNLVAEGFYV